MAESKSSFLLYTDLINVVALLSDEQAGKLFRTILEYVNDKDPEPEDMLTKLAFEPIRLQLKRDLRGWEERKLKRSEAGKKGMDHRWGITKDNNVTDDITNITVNDTVTVNGNVNGTVKRVREVFHPPSQEDVVTEMMKCLDDFSAMAEASKFHDYYTSNGWMVGKNKMKDWKSTVRNWIRNSTKFQKNGQSKQGTSEARTERAKNW